MSASDDVTLPCDTSHRPAWPDTKGLIHADDGGYLIVKCCQRADPDRRPGPKT